MSIDRDKGLYIRIVAETFLIYSWLVNLSTTESYYSVYLLCAAVGFICMMYNCIKNIALPREMMVCGILFSALFSMATLLANYKLFEPITALLSMFNLFCSFCGGLFVAIEILACTMHFLPMKIDMRDVSAKQTGKLFLGQFVVIITVDLLYLFFVAYPGVLTRDSVTTITQIVSGDYNNTMPYWHTMTVKLFYNVGYFLFANANAAVALFHCVQICFMAACFSYALTTLFQAGVPKGYIVIAFLVYTLMPYNIVYSVTLWKDVLFGGAALLWVTALYRIMRGIGKSTFQNYVMLAIGAIGFSLWRTNGWYAFLITTLLMLIFMRKKYKNVLSVMSSVVIFCGILIGPVLSVLDVSSTDMVEAFAVPFQQIGRVISEDRELTQEDTALLSEAFDLEKVKELYEPEIVDPIKFEAFRRGNLRYIKDHFLDYIKLYLRLGMRYPDDYLKAWIEETKGYWNGGYSYWIYTSGVEENEFGLESHTEYNIIGNLYRMLFRLIEDASICEPFLSIGLCVWLVIGCCLANVLKKREEWLLTIPMLVLIVGLWLGTPVFAEFRYAYPFFAAVPFLGAVTVFSVRQE